MTNQKTNPKVEWGYYATTPRIVRTQYKDLSHTEKWLYVCLKDLCGDKGTCYRTLKALSQETDLSTGNLSTGIRHLHEAGLIHAEKKRRSNNPTAKEVWHITIVDIWQANVDHCSNFERSTDNVQNLNENVQEMNNNVQILNNPPAKRSNSEPKRSNFVDRSNNTEEQHITEERTIEEESIPAPESHAPTISPPVVGDSRASLTEFEEKMTIKEAEIRQMLEGQTSEEVIQQTIETFRQAVLVHRETRYLELPIPTTYDQAVIFLAPHGGVPPGYDALQVLKLAQKLWVEAHEDEEDITQAETVKVPVVSKPVVEPAQQNRSAGTPNGAVVGDVPLGNPPAQGAASPKWGIEAMVAEAERLREKPFSAIAKPKETKKAQALFKRKPDLTQEEFEDAWKNWDTDWWRKTNGPFTLTDLAATPKDKSEMRLILALEKLALAKANPRQSSQFVSVPRVRVFSSYDDPNFRSDQDFYPVEGGSYAAVV